MNLYDEQRLVDQQIHEADAIFAAMSPEEKLELLGGFELVDRQDGGAQVYVLNDPEFGEWTAVSHSSIANNIITYGDLPVAYKGMAIPVASREFSDDILEKRVMQAVKKMGENLDLVEVENYLKEQLGTKAEVGEPLYPVK